MITKNTFFFLLITFGSAACSPLATSVPKKFNPGSGSTGGGGESLQEPAGAPGSIGPGDEPFRDPINTTEPAAKEVRTTALTTNDYDDWVAEKEVSEESTQSAPKDPAVIELTAKQLTELKHTGETIVDVTALLAKCPDGELKAAVAMALDAKAIEKEIEKFNLRALAKASAGGKKTFAISIDLTKKTKRAEAYADLITAVALIVEAPVAEVSLKP